MRKPNAFAAVIVWTTAIGLISLIQWMAAAGAQEDEAQPLPLEPPRWRVGDTWTIESVTRREQGREDTPATEPARLRWKFHVAKLEPIAGRECYRIDIRCLAKGRMQPDTTIWCDKETKFLRQFQTQLPAAGQYVLVHESYTAEQQASPVLPPVTALPVAMPAFVQKGAKSSGSFNFTSQPMPAGAKDAAVIPFGHVAEQSVRKPSAKTMQLVPESYSKSLEQQPIREVQLSDGSQTVVQLWQADVPWPVYTDNGHTQAWLVPDSAEAN
jgi:hypothetical protein